MAESREERLDRDGPPYKLVFEEETLTVIEGYNTPPAEHEVETTFLEADLENLVITQTITGECLIELDATIYRLWLENGTWTLDEYVEP